MSNILAFDTATNACSVALQVGDLQLEQFDVAPRQHSQRLLPTIDRMLKKDGLAFEDLDVIACGIGPGSFMGVRLAVSVAQGLAYACQKPVVGISTLQILAQTAYEQLGFERVVAAWDARMDEIYHGSYIVREGFMQATSEDALIAPGQWACDQKGEWQLVGNAWSAYSEQLNLPNNVALSEQGSELYPHAKALLALADNALQQNNTLSAINLEPNYIRQKVTF